MDSFVFNNFGVKHFMETSEEAMERMNKELAAGDKAAFLQALGAMLKERGMTVAAKELGMTREGLYKSFSPDGNPSFQTVLQVMGKLGMVFTIAYKAAL
jgi:probable addiction module antidote protein